MLVLSRKLDQEIIIGDEIRIRILKIKGNTIRIGIEAPDDVRVIRGELEFDISSDDLSDGISIETSKNSSDNEITFEFQNKRGTEGSKHSSRLASDILPFESAQQLKSRKTAKTNRASTPALDGYHAVSFREPIPSNLQHNRLKELVQQITRPK